MAGELSKEELNKKIKNSIKNLQDLKSGDLKKLPKSEEQIKNKGKKKLQDAYKESPRGNPAVVETYEDARENAMINRDVPTMKNGGNTVKPVKAVLGVLALGAAGAMGAKKLMKKNKVASVLSPVSNLLMEDEKKSKNQKETGDVKTMSTGGEISFGKGSDYIKDLID